MAFRSGSGLAYDGGASSAAIPVPTGAAAGDIAVVDLFVEWSSGTVTPPSGFTLLTSQAKTGSPAWIHYVYWKRLTAGDTGSYSFGLSTSAAIMGGCNLYTGRIASGSPFDTSTGAVATATANSGACPGVSITPTTAGVDLHYGVMTYNTGAATAPAGWTAGGTHPDGVMTAHKDNQAASSTGTVACTSPGDDAWTVELSALLPAGGGSTTVQKTSATSWDVRAAVAKTSATTWAVRAAVGKTSVTNWAVRQQVAKSSATTWDVGGSLTTVQKTSATTWNVVGRLNKTASTSWNVAASVGKTSATSWAVRVVVGKTGATSWAVRAAVVKTSATSWNVAGPVVRFWRGVSANGRYFVDQTGDPFLVHGDTAWSMMLDLDLSSSGLNSAPVYFSTRQSQGFNATLMSAIGTTFTGGPSDDGDTFDGINPFTSLWRCDLPNETYWARVDAILSLAESYGFTVLLYACDTFGAQDRIRAATNQAQRIAYGAFLATRYGSRPNVMWAFGGDFDNNGPNWSNNNPILDDILTGIRNITPNAPVTLQLTGFPQSNSFDNSFWDNSSGAAKLQYDFVYSYNPTYDSALLAWQHTWAQSPTTRPVLFGEGNYENENNKPATPFTTNETLRRQMLWAITSGAFGTYYGATAVWEFRKTDFTWAQSMTDGAFPAQAQKLVNRIKALPWHKLAPDLTSQLVTAGRGTYVTGGGNGATSGTDTDPLDNNYVTAALATDGSLAMVYVPAGGSITVDTSKVPGYTAAYWVDPTNADSTTTATFSSGVTTPPGTAHGDGSHDWLLVMEGPGSGTTIQKTSATSWNVAGRVAKTSQTNWNVLAPVGKTSATTWSVRAGVAKSSATAWDVRAAAVKTSQTAWDVRQQAVKTAATSWDTAGSATTVQKTAATTWNVVGRLNKTSATSWSLGGVVQKTASTTWDVRGAAGKTSATGWAVRTSGTQTCATSWAVRSRVLKTNASSWNVASDAVVPIVRRPTVRIRPNPARARIRP